MTNHVHITGICGVGTGALAVALKNAGYKVTGSDKGFFPPVSTSLKEVGVDFYAGYHPEKIGKPDFFVAGGGGTSENNPEIKYAKENNIPIMSFAEAVGKFVVKEKSIVCVGTWGKTTSTALLSHIFKTTGKNPNYFFGGLSLSNPSGAITDSEISIVEGDEYQSAIYDKKPKFAYYRPTDILLTAVSWDHADLYPTEESYFRVFKNLIENAKGSIVISSDNEGTRKIMNETNKDYITFGKEGHYSYSSVSQDENGLSFTISNSGKTYPVTCPILGVFNVENITGCFAMAHNLGIEADKIIGAIKSFKGLKRRLERRFEGKITLIDDIAHSPEKARSTLGEIRAIYKGKILAVFEPNIGGRQRDISAKYDGVFAPADEVIIPRLSALKNKIHDSRFMIHEEDKKAITGEELRDVISKTHDNTRYIEDDEQLVSYLIKTAEKGDVIVFLGSHGFRGMIEETIAELTQIDADKTL